MVLSCAGTVSSYEQTGTDIEVPSDAVQEARKSAGLPPAGIRTSERNDFVKRPSRLTIVVDGASVKVRWRADARWQDLSDVVISEGNIRAKEKGFLPSRLLIDRRTGDVTFGAFSGACEKTTDGPGGRKF